MRTDSRKGIGTLSDRELPFIFSPATFASAEIHLPRVESDLLILAPSLRRAPVAPVAFALSEPAKSTKHNLHNRTALCKYHQSNKLVSYFFPLARVFWKRIVIVNTECERDDSLFIFVDAVVRCSRPISNKSSTSL